MPAASRLQSNLRDIDNKFSKFSEEVYEPFIAEVADEIEAEIKVDPVTEAFGCLDVRNFPSRKANLGEFGDSDIKILINHFGFPKEGQNPSTSRINRADPKIDKNTTKQEYEVFKEVAFDIFAKRKHKLTLELERLRKLIKTTLQT